jgi:hypothetical protein
MKPPSDFDWVTARSRCSLAVVFQQMRMEVEEDIRKRNDQRPKDCGYEFSVVLNHSVTGFTVLVSGSGVNQRVVGFYLRDKTIAVHKNGSHKPNIEALLTFNNDGECRLKIAGVEYDFWQVRRMALEELLFEVV